MNDFSGKNIVVTGAASGIGLAVVADIVQSYGGKIAVERSQMLGGAAISILLGNIRLQV